MNFPTLPGIFGHMVTKNDFTATEWNALRDAPCLVGFATLMAGSSGLGTFKEAIAIGRGILENQASEIPLLREMSSQTELEAAQTSLKQTFGGPQQEPAKDTSRRLALEKARSALTILGNKATPQETEAYRRSLYSVAENVAGAAREGGFLGFGGKDISEGEQAFLDELRDSLQLERARRA